MWVHSSLFGEGWVSDCDRSIAGEAPKKTGQLPVLCRCFLLAGFKSRRLHRDVFLVFLQT